MAKIRCGVVGLKHGMAHVVEVLKHPDMEVAALCARTTETYDFLTGKKELCGPLESVTFTEPREKLIAEARRRKDFSEVPFFTDFNEFLAHADMDAVIIAVPIQFNGKYALQAVQSGRHVLASKPFALTLEEGRELKRAVAESDRVFMVNFEFRHSPLMLKIRQTISRGEIGAVRQMWWNMYRMPFRAGYRKKAESGGAFVAEICHWIDLFHFFNESIPFRKVCAFGGLDVLTGQDFEDNVVSIIEYENGVRASINFTYFTDQPEHNLFGVVGETGKITATTDGAGRFTTYSGNKHKLTYEVNPEVAHQGHLGFDVSHDRFARAILGEIENDSNREAELGYESLLVSIAAQKSLDEGRIIWRRELEG